jgi:hypothetical protein
MSAGLTLTSPHVGHPGHAGHATGDGSRCATVVGDRSVSVVVTPARVGTNAVVVGGVPVDMRSVTLHWAHDLTEGGALTMEASPDPAGWTAAGALPLPGSWEVTVTVRVDTFTQESGACRLRVEP